MAQNLYGPGVRMGNWNEDVYLEEVRRTSPDALPLAAEEHPQVPPAFEHPKPPFSPALTKYSYNLPLL
ncbi:hypothetical protein PAL_GLEAN10009566 [Pteropus alecto]|uniref:Uncharacterized protein n=1 Tax=Pteropus alecto TaxID=9402 RepID=L5L5K4_PTEAL|nr:hypothetical protein PAL_GLEAN10009566 [Pteropus alecto]